MEQLIKYSVIIPVYNAQKSIARCLESLTNQGRDDVQIIVIDDGSSDQSGAIITSYMQDNKEIQYTYQENSGVSAARNAGLRRARGKYVTFVDSDDYVLDDYFSVLDQQPDCDLLVFASQTDGVTSSNENQLYSALQERQSKETVMDLLLSSRKIMPPWNKRFKRSIIQENKLEFICGMQIGEDFNFCFAYASVCKNIGICAQEIYCVDVTDTNSLSRKYRPALADQMCQVFQYAIRIDSENYYGAMLDYLFVKNTFTCIAEEFKVKRLSWWCDKRQIQNICDSFRQPLAHGYVSLIHRALRLMLKCRLDLLIYLVAWLVKGRQYGNQAKG